MRSPETSYAEELPFIIVNFDGFIVGVMSRQSVLGDKSKYFEPARECGHCCFAIFIAAILPTLDVKSDQGVVCCRYLLQHDCCI